MIRLYSVQANGYQATLKGDVGEEQFFLANLDASSEVLMDLLLYAIMDLKEEGKTISDVHYKGKGVRRWFKMVYPDILDPKFFGIFSSKSLMIGYLVAFQSPLMSTRKVIGIALVQSVRGKGIGTRVIKHIQEHLSLIFSTEVNELNFETGIDNIQMQKIGRNLCFKEFYLPDEDQWKDSRQGRIRFTWSKTNVREPEGCTSEP